MPKMLGIQVLAKKLSWCKIGYLDPEMPKVGGKGRGRCQGQALTFFG